MDLQKVVPASCSESCPASTSSNDADPFINIKTEEVLDREVGEDLPPVMYPGIKTECEVSCMCVLGAVYRIYCRLSYLLLYVSPAIHVKQLQSCE
jgi:hypothetical protein